jgi:Ni/Fe-hydrogenase 1 B-type cytochrome subunit
MKRFSLSLRIWHWLNAIVVLGLLGTFFLRKTFLSWRENSQIIMHKLAEFDIIITIEQAKILAKAVRAPMWEWHIILGFMFAFLLLWRWGMILKNGFGYEDDVDTHMKWVHRLYKLMYSIFSFMVISGLFLYFSHDFGVDKNIVHQIKELHEMMAWGVVGFVVIHIAGVVIAENKEDKGLISKMISG